MSHPVPGMLSLLPTPNLIPPSELDSGSTPLRKPLIPLSLQLGTRAPFYGLIALYYLYIYLPCPSGLLRGKDAAVVTFGSPMPIMAHNT